MKVVAHANYVKEAEAFGQEIRLELSRWEKKAGFTREKPFVIPLPDETFEGEMVLNVGRLEVRLIHVPGHAADQLAVYHAESGLLWASDILSDIEIPYVGHSLVAYEKTLERLAKLKINALVPGHGSETNDAAEIQRRIEWDRRYLAQLRSRIESAVRDGKAVEETVEACADMEIHHLDYNATEHRLNVESAYIELG